MPNEKANNKKEKLLCVDNLRHAEYYEMQGVFDDLYARSKCGEEFTNLMSLILSRENILLAYRNIKTNAGSKTAGTDGLTISDIGRLTAEQVVDKVRFIAAGSPHGYRPKAVRRKDIPKPYDPTKTRPLGIPCIWDKAKLFTPQREAIGTCPRCGAAVYEGKKNFYCSDRACSFVMWKNDRFFEQRKKAFTKAIAAALLKDGKVKIKGMYSTKTGKTFDGVVLLADTGGKYVNFRVEQNRK